MIIESVTLSKERQRFNFKPTDPFLLRDIEAYITIRFNELLKENIFISGIFNDLFEEGFEGVIFGGWVRDRVIELITGVNILSKDIDFVCKGSKELSKHFFGKKKVSENMFGGYLIEYPQMHIDIWELDKTYLISKNSLSKEFSSLLTTADYTINSIIYYPRQGKSKPYLLDFGCIESIKNKEMDFLADEIAFPIIQAARAAIFSAKFNLSLSNTIENFIKVICDNDLNVNKVLTGIENFCPPEHISNAKKIINSIIK